MTSRSRRAIVRGVGVGLLVIGLAATAWFCFTDLLGGRSAVLCTDPEAWACSGHSVHGVANEVWSIAVAAIGVVGLTASRTRSRQASHP